MKNKEVMTLWSFAVIFTKHFYDQSIWILQMSRFWWCHRLDYLRHIFVAVKFWRKKKSIFCAYGVIVDVPSWSSCIGVNIIIHLFRTMEFHRTTSNILIVLKYEILCSLLCTKIECGIVRRWPYFINSLHLHSYQLNQDLMFLGKICETSAEVS